MERASLEERARPLGTRLPLELLLQVCSVATRSTQIAVICSCKTVFDLHAPSLYRVVYIPRALSLTSLCFMLESLAARPALAACVRHFDFTWKTMSASWRGDGKLSEEYAAVLSALRPALRLMHHLHTLVIPDGYWVSDWDASELPTSLERLSFMPPAGANAALGRLTRVTHLMAYDGDGSAWDALSSFGSSRGLPMQFVRGGASLLQAILSGRGLAAGCTVGLTSAPDRAILSLLQQYEHHIDKIAFEYDNMQVGNEWLGLRFGHVRNVEVALLAWTSTGVSETVNLLNCLLPSFPAVTLLLLTYGDSLHQEDDKDALINFGRPHAISLGVTASSLRTIHVAPEAQRWSRLETGKWSMTQTSTHVPIEWYDAPTGFIS